MAAEVPRKKKKRKGRENKKTRTVLPNTLSEPNQRYANNQIKTTKYTLLSFLPKNLFEQFHRFANVYFVFIALLNFVPALNAFQPELALAPVLFILSVTAIKDLWEDFRRHRSDTEINHLDCLVYCRYCTWPVQQGRRRSLCWSEVKRMGARGGGTFSKKKCFQNFRNSQAFRARVDFLILHCVFRVFTLIDRAAPS